MFAVIRTGGKQYKVAKDDVISVEKLLGEPGDTVELGDGLMIGKDGKAPTVGTPLIEKAAVFAEVVNQAKGDKIHRLQETTPSGLPPQTRPPPGFDLSEGLGSQPDGHQAEGRCEESRAEEG